MREESAEPAEIEIARVLFASRTAKVPREPHFNLDPPLQIGSSDAERRPFSVFESTHSAGKKSLSEFIENRPNCVKITEIEVFCGKLISSHWIIQVLKFFILF